MVRPPRLLLAIVLIASASFARASSLSIFSPEEGARDGSGIRQQSSTRVPPPSLEPHTNITCAEYLEIDPEESSVASLTTVTALPSGRSRLTHKTGTIPIPVDLLLVCRRRNI